MLFSLLSNKSIIFSLVGVVFIVSVLGGALGAAFGLGFISNPLPVISLAAEPAFHIGSVAIANTTIMFIASGLVLLFLAWRATRKMTEVPSGLQNLFEAVYDFFTGMANEMGGAKARKFLPIVILMFLVILASNWFGIIPGVGSFGRVETISEWIEIHADSERTKLAEAHPEYSAKQVETLALIETVLHESDHRFAVFGSDTLVTVIPFGQNQNTLAPLSAIVPLAQEEERLKELLHDIEDHGLNNISGTSSLTLAELESQALIGQVQEPYVGRDGRMYDCTGNRTSASSCDQQNPAGVLIPFLRGASTDLNTTLSFALIASVAIQLFGITSLGLFGYLGKFINFKDGPIGFFVGILEIIAEVARVVSFTFRLFGNTFAGEILLVAMAFLLPLIGIIPFLGLELFVGVVQAFIFATLLLVFSVMAAQPHGEHEEGH